jgi:hypothetical protein
MVTKGFISEPVEFPRFCVSLDLAIPCSCIELSEPPPKLSEFGSRETGDSLLEGFEFTHKKKRYHHLLFSRGNASPLSSRPRVPRGDHLSIANRLADGEITVPNFVPCCAQNCALTVYSCRSPDVGRYHQPKCRKSLCPTGFVDSGYYGIIPIILGVLELEHTS